MEVGFGMALPIVPSTLLLGLRLGKARGWASTRGWSFIGARGAMPIVPSSLYMGLRLGRLGGGFRSPISLFQLRFRCWWSIPMGMNMNMVNPIQFKTSPFITCCWGLGPPASL